MNSLKLAENPLLVLVVDDDKFMRLQLREAMEQGGYIVTEAENGEQALDLYTKINPDVVLLDALMPVMDGFNCCKQMRCLPRKHPTPILMITALEDPESVDLAFEVGATDYVTKPIHWAVLRQRVRHLLQVSQAMVQLQVQKEKSHLKAEQLKLALESAGMGTWDWNLLTNEVIYSEHLKPLFGLPADSNYRTYQALLNSIHPEDRHAVTQSVAQAIERDSASAHAGLRNFSTEFRVIWADGSIHWVANRGQVYYENAKPMRLLGIAMDITARKTTEQERLVLLVQQAARSQAEISRNQITNIIESITDAFFALDKQWQFTYINRQAELILQKTRSQLIGKNFWQEYPEAVNLAFYEQYHQAVSQQVSVQFVEFYLPLNIWVSVHAYPAKDGLSVYFQDITERKQNEVKLLESQKRLQLLSEVTLKIRQSLQIDEILKTTATEVLNLLQADRVLIFRLFKNGYGQIVVEATTPESASIVDKNITDECFGEEYLKKYSQGRIYSINDIEKAQIKPCLVEFMQSFGVKAKLVVPILLKQKLWGLTIIHQCSKPRNWTNFEIEVLQQLADQIGIALAQAQLLEDESRQRQELARSNSELQEFAYIASHDLQEPLRKIQAFGDRLQAQYSEKLGDRGKDYLARMHNAAARMQALIHDLLSLSQVITKAQPFVSVDLNQLTQEVLLDLELAIEQTGGRVEVGQLSTIEADPLQIRQLIQNLISNALKFHSAEVTPVIKVSSQMLEVEQGVAEKLVVTLCQITIEDNGIGFDEKYLDRIFNVFQRLHNRSEYEGTGMGLAICRKVAERHGGTITALSTPGQGATFIVTLPIKQAGEQHYSETANGTNNSDG
ncbi:response regulator [Chlorogloea sp. CCALA 695]|uniref:response regulator n=1 Tax=Chlorogloea sp. CCALA 695 TaxID=2107693 RepID=UPI000D068055|nr:response regulator [Chlorogloea sp. CCALA 695]PSB34831.1 histidine kinase [Chlorogloea sp. CCALA 695]